MQAKKCDRCGVFFVESSNRNFDGIWVPAGLGTWELYDLCDDCLNALYIWIKPKEGDNTD